MKKFLPVFIAFIFLSQLSTAQVKIGSLGTPNANAVLELDGGTNKGLLLPKLTAGQIALLTTAPDGLFVYNNTDGFLYVRKGGAWQKITDATTGGNGLVLPYLGSTTTTVGNTAFKVQNTAGIGISGESLGSGYGITGYSATGTGGYFSSGSGPALVTGSGNVGIGTSILYPPTFPLDVTGRIRIRNKGNETPGLWFEKISTPLEQSSFFGVVNDSVVGLYGAKNNSWKFFFNHDNNNFGINNSNPRAPLSFAAINGNKIDVYYEGPTAMYGMGIGSAELQLYSANPGAHTSIGYGASAAFTETFRINNNGTTLINNPVTLAANTEIATYFKTNNKYSGAIKVIGTGTNTARLGLFAYTGNAATDLKEYLSINDNGNVGIENIAPTNPLSFPATLEKKISLYPGATGDVGLAVSGNELRIYSDNSAAVTTIGFDDFINGFKEIFRVDPSGATTITNPSALLGNVQSASYFKTGNTYTGAIKTIGNSFFGARMGFFTSASSNPALLDEAMTINNIGKVGINSTDPNSTLQVGGSVSMPIKIITGNYTATDNDYSIRFIPSGNGSAQLSLPAAAGRTGRIYVISIDCGYSAGVNYPTLYVRDNNNVNVIANNAAYYDGATAANGAIEFNALMYVQFNNLETNLPVKRKVSITVQSDGNRWVIIDGDFKN